MSAYIVSHDCVHRVVVALRAMRGDFMDRDRDLLGMELLQMNRRACVARYGDNNVEQVDGYRYVEPMPKDGHLIVQVYKSLRCFLYQCSEGDVPDEPLYLVLLDVRDKFATLLGHEGDERWSKPAVKAAYDECEWG